jgi:hypothetical protein
MLLEETTRSHVASSSRFSSAGGAGRIARLPQTASATVDDGEGAGGGGNEDGEHEAECWYEGVHALTNEAGAEDNNGADNIDG